MSCSLSVRSFRQANPIVASVFALFFSSVTLAGCGGGGGGGGSGDGASTTGIRVLHGAIDAAPLDVSSSAAPSVVVQRTAFGMPSSYAALPDGRQIVRVGRAKTPDSQIANFNLTVDSSQRFSVLFFGDNANFGLSARVVEDLIPEESGDGALLRVIDGMTGASEVSVVATTSGAARSNGQEYRVSFGGVSQYLQVPVGALRVSAKRVADGRILRSVDVTLSAGSAYTFFLAGEADYFVKALLLTDR